MIDLYLRVERPSGGIGTAGTSAGATTGANKRTAAEGGEK
jgi:hypothetical protein